MARPRCTDAHARILEATNELLETQAVADLCIEDIAGRAKVGKQTIYKWWGGKRALAMEAVLSTLQATVPFTDTGDVRRDLLAFLRKSGKALREKRTARTLASLMAEAQCDPDFLEAFRREFLTVRRNGLRDVVKGGIARGELKRGLDPELFLDVVFGAYWYRLLSQRAPIDDRFADEVLGLLLPGALAATRKRAA
jgi:AcrR family transcriptional regulator